MIAIVAISMVVIAVLAYYAGRIHGIWQVSEELEEYIYELEQEHKRAIEDVRENSSSQAV